MCGIAGIVGGAGGPPVDLDRVRSMLAVIAHRGPDGHGLFRDDRVGLGHARLSIVDLAGGFQPLTGEDRSVWLTFNGEIFNHVELRRELEALGHRFTTPSDSEVIVHAYEEYGERAWPMFNGQFAFALWDRRAGRLWLVRDRLGILPLHWAEAAGQVVFASEAKALFAGGLLDPAIDPAGLAQVFTRWSARAPATAFAGVRAVRPGGAVCIETVSGDADGPARTTPRCAGGSPTWPSTPPRRPLARGRRRRARRAPGRRGPPPAAGRRAGGRLPERRPRLVGHRLAGPPGRRQPARDLRGAVPRRGVRRDPRAAPHGRAARHRPPRDPVRTRRDRRRAGGGGVALRGAAAAHRAGAAVPAVGARARRRHEGRAHRRGRRRAAGRLQHLQGGPGAPVLGPAARVGDAARAVRPAAPRGPGRRRPVDRHVGALLRARPHRSRPALLRPPGALAEHRVDGPPAAPRPAGRRGHAARRLGADDTLLAEMPPGLGSWDPLARAQWVEIATFLSSYLLSSQGDRVAMAHGVEVRYPFLDPEVVAFCAGCRPIASSSACTTRRPSGAWRRGRCRPRSGAGRSSPTGRR